MSKQELYNRRLEDIKKTVSGIEPQYVPVVGNANSGVISYAGMTNRQALERGHEALIEGYTKIYEDMYVDGLIDYGIYVNQGAYDAMGGGQNSLGPDDTTIEHRQNSLMNEEEYHLLIDDPDSFVSDVLLRRKYPYIFTEDIIKAAKRIQEAIDDFGYIYGFINPAILNKLIEKYGIVPIAGEYGAMTNPVDILFDSFRGFVGTVTDLRRRPDKVKEALNVLWEKRCGHMDNMQSDFPYPAQYPHIPAYLNKKQFERFYWPYEKQLIENICKAGSKSTILLEGRWLHLLDFFKDIPKDSVILQVDDDDIFEVKKAIGDYQTIAGGVSMQMLKFETIRKCTDYIKTVFDVLAPGGRFIFRTNKDWVCPSDINRNLIDVHNFAHEYGKY